MPQPGLFILHDGTRGERFGVRSSSSASDIVLYAFPIVDRSLQHGFLADVCLLRIS